MPLDPRPTPPHGHRRPSGVALLALTATVIGVATLAPGSPVPLEPTDLTCLVCGSAGTADVIRNLLLFLPLGVAGALLGWRWPRALAAGFALSLTVESLQLLVVPGRDPSLSDLLTNTVGTAVGFALAAGWSRWGSPSRRGARALAAAGAVAWAAF
ncbi:MAG: VanZ family protein, partial [Gemmatimonadaceae bacterium]